jgi:hypothetical protein
MPGRSWESLLLNQDYRDILSEFCAENVEFLLVGAYAMAAHGLPRATGDIDLWIRCSAENAARVMTALKRFGAPLADVSATDFVRPGIVFQIGVVPRRIDVTTTIDGIDFETAWPDRLGVVIDGLPVNVIGREHLLRNKIASGRPKDLADAAWLQATPHNPEAMV